jgi:hypothetical protein
VYEKTIIFFRSFSSMIIVVSLKKEKTIIIELKDLIFFPEISSRKPFGPRF